MPPGYESQPVTNFDQFIIETKALKRKEIGNLVGARTTLYDFHGIKADDNAAVGVLPK